MELKDKILQNQSSHWYWPDGSPAYEVDSSDGKKKVKTTIIQARKLGLYPSVTTVFKILNKEMVNVWRIEQMFKACQSLKKLETESYDQYLDRITEESERLSNVAKSFGDAIHKYCEYALGGQTHLINEPIPKETALAIEKFIFENIKDAETEKKLVNSTYHYAGTTDALCLFQNKKSIVDFKTQGTLDKSLQPRKPIYYDDFVYQGAAYLMCVDAEQFVSVIISRDEPGRIEYKIWTDDEVTRAKDIFLTLLQLFKQINNMVEL